MMTGILMMFGCGGFSMFAHDRFAPWVEKGFAILAGVGIALALLGIVLDGGPSGDGGRCYGRVCP